MIELKYRMFKTYDGFRRFIAWHLPKGIVMWCYMRVVAHATGGKYSNDNVTNVLALTAIDRFVEDHKVI